MDQEEAPDASETTLDAGTLAAGVCIARLAAPSGSVTARLTVAR